MELTLDRPRDPEALRDRVRAQWDRAAEGWDRHAASIGRWLDDVTAAMIDLARIGPGTSVLDLAAGDGAQMVEIAPSDPARPGGLLSLGAPHACDQIERELEVFRTDDGSEGPNELLVVWGEA